MTLTTTIQAIDDTYPIYGQPNDTQGFRDNFSNIKTSLELVDTSLQSILSTYVSTSTSDVSLNGNTLQNFTFKNAFSAAQIEAMTQTADIDVDLLLAGSQYFKYKIGADLTLTVDNWPASGNYVNFKLELVSNGTSYNITVEGPGGSTIKVISPLTNNVLSTSAINNCSSMFEVWSTNSGTTINIRKLGDLV